jgi:DNA modification methylase
MTPIDPTTSGYYTGDCRKLLKRLPDGCVQMCVTSPPFWGLRDYGHKLQIGLEDTPEKYIKVLVKVFDEVRRVLRDDGTLWLNLGDCYAGSRSGPQGGTGQMADRTVSKHRGMMSQTKGIDPKNPRKGPGSNDAPNRRRHPKLKHKDLVGIPWMAAFALRNAGWYLRMDNIWSKPNPLPESVTDRTTKAHEYLFHFSKSATYYYDNDAIAEPVSWGGQHRNVIAPDESHMPGAPDHTGLRKYKSGNKARQQRSDHGGARDRSTNQTFGVPWEGDEDSMRNKRSVWTVTPSPYKGAHFATFPPALIEPCILACSRPGDLVLDPFFGTGTTGEVAEKHERIWIGFDVNPEYAELAKERTAQRSLPLARSSDLTFPGGAR